MFRKLFVHISASQVAQGCSWSAASLPGEVHGTLLSAVWWPLCVLWQPPVLVAASVLERRACCLVRFIDFATPECNFERTPLAKWAMAIDVGLSTRQFGRDPSCDSMIFPPRKAILNGLVKPNDWSQQIWGCQRLNLGGMPPAIRRSRHPGKQFWTDYEGIWRLYEILYISEKGIEIK